MPQHKAARFAAQGKPAEVVEVETTSPSEGQVLVKAHAWAVNPVDHAMRDRGIFVKAWPLIVGSDVAGEIVEVGPGVQSHKKGDRVLLITTFITGTQAEAGYQELVVVPAVAAAKIPDNMKFTDAVVVPLSAATSVAGLYQKDALALDLPSTNPKPNGKKLLVWGASTSVAASVIQFAVASGYEVIATASPKNFDHAKKLGASKVFDYKSPSVVGDLTAELQNGTCVGAYDAITNQDSQLNIATVLAQLGGGKIASVLTPVAQDLLPATVSSVSVFAGTIFAPKDPVGLAVFQDFLPQALASGQYVPQPQAEVVGSGLGAVEDAINKHKAGVSAKKIVISA